jgi:hypothetical protein
MKIESKEQHIRTEFNFLRDDKVNNTEHIPLTLGQNVLILNQNIIDSSTGKYAEVPCRCIFIEPDTKYPFFWYYFEALNPDLNGYEDPKFPQKYHAILRSIDPKIKVV